MRGLVVVIGLAGCGRFGFEDRTQTSDGHSDSGGPTGDGPSEGWTRIAAGDQTTCGIYKSRAYCWGRGSNHEIGDGNATNRPSPTEVALPAGTVTDVVQGEGNACAVVDGAAYCWGSAGIGNGAPSSMTPAAVSLPATITSISAGGQFACAIANASLYCWGNETSGSLGNGAAGSSFTPQLVTLPATPIAVDAGNDHAVALLSNGNVVIWGHNDVGCFGTGSTTPTSSDVPVMSNAAANVLPRIAGWHACVVTNKVATCWGEGATYGSLGTGQFNDSSQAVQPIVVPQNVDVLETGGGPSNHDATCAAAAGIVWCWGSGIYGRLGDGLTTNQATPQQVQNLPADIVELALGFEHTCARSAGGTVRCWGRGDLGQLGDGQSTNSLTPVVVPLPP